MSGLSPVAMLAVVLTGVVAAGAAAQLKPPTRRLAGRVRPYSVAARTALGRPADVAPVAAPARHRTALMRLLGPLLERAARFVGRHLDGSSDERLLLRLRQADLLGDVPASRRVLELRTREVGTAVAWAALAATAGVAITLPPAAVVTVGLLGMLAGATRWRARIDRRIEDRRARMRIELYTVNQLLALSIRVGGGIVQALRRIVDRGNGAVVDELAEVLALHESGLSIAEALGRAAAQTPEPQVARTYRLLAAGAHHGADLAEALLDHSEDVRETRREALKRAATRRRAAMLVPIIGVLAPVMLLFIIAPLPSLIFGP